MTKEQRAKVAAKGGRKTAKMRGLEYMRDLAAKGGQKNKGKKRSTN